MPVISALENRSAFTLQRPGRHVDHTRLFGIEEDVVHNVISVVADMRKTLPSAATIIRFKNLSRTGAQQNAVRVMRIVS